MILSDSKDEKKLMMLLSSIKQHMDEWQIVNVNILKDTTASQKNIIDRLLDNYEAHEGLIYPVSEKKIVMLVRLGVVHDYTNIKASLEKKLPQHSCRITVKKLNKIGIKQIQVDLSERNSGLELTDNMFVQRKERKDNVLLIADDDSFVRLSLVKLLTGCGDIEEVSAGKEVLSTYLKVNPDILFLDIHMPDQTGLDILPKILEIDPDACIIMLSADSQRQNVLSALDMGAIGFLSKPPNTEKIQEYISQCITIR